MSDESGAKETREMKEAREALMRPGVVGAVLSHLPWRDLSSCRLVGPLWRLAVDGLREERPPLLYSVDEGGAECVRGLFRGPPLVSFVFNDWTHRGGDVCASCRKGPRRDRESGPVVELTAMRVSASGDASDGGARPLVRAVTLPRFDGVRTLAVDFGLPEDSDADSDEEVELSSDPAAWRSLQRFVDANFVECVLTFSTDITPRRMGVAVDLNAYIASKQRARPQFAVGGGVVHGMRLNDGVKDETRDRVTFVLFGAPKSNGTPPAFKAYSTVIKMRGTSVPEMRAQMEKTFKTMAERAKPLVRSVALKFTSHLGHGLEEELFPKYFPDTPMVGCASHWEIGVVNYESDEPPAPTDRDYDFENRVVQNATSIVILTWNDSKTEDDHFK